MRIIFFLLISSRIFSQDTSDSSTMMMLLDGDVFNATRTIKELKENNLDNMITYFYQIGYSDTSDNLELPLVIKKQYPKALIDSKLLEERIKKNKLFDNKRASIEPVSYTHLTLPTKA